MTFTTIEENIINHRVTSIIKDKKLSDAMVNEIGRRLQAIIHDKETHGDNATANAP